MKKKFFLGGKASYIFLTGGFLFLFSCILNAEPNIITISGNQRISEETIILIGGLSNKSEFSDVEVNYALKKLTESGLFSNVKIKKNNNKLFIEVLENPIISQVLFEGNSILSDAELLATVNSTARNAYNEELVMMDVKRLSQHYQRKGRYNAIINPQFIVNSDSSVKLIFVINEGDLLEVQDVIFIGNKEFTNQKLFSVTPSRKKGFFRL